MKLQNERQLNSTRDKLRLLKEQYEATRQRPCDSERVRELTLTSLGRLIKQLQEEIIWYECHARTRELSSPAVTPTTNTGETSAPCTN
jgi:hypothetical protein